MGRIGGLSFALAIALWSPALALAQATTLDLVHVRARADASELVLHRIEVAPAQSPARFTRLCALPCELDLGPGSYLFALAHGGGAPAYVGPPVSLAAGPASLDVHFEDRSTIRTVGWVTLVVGAVSGVLMALFGFILHPGQPDVALMFAGGAVFAVGLTLGLVLGSSMRDELTLRVSPVPI